MNVGREMDALVAERVMGMGSQWTIQMNDDGTFSPTGEVWYECPYFSAEMDAAYLVMQKLGLALVPQSTDSGFAWLACDLEAVRYGAAGITLVEKPGTAISAPTAPEAVCRAALASVGVRE